LSPESDSESDELRQKSKIITSQFTEALNSDPLYTSAKQDLASINADIKQAKAKVADEDARELAELEEIKNELKNQTISDLAISSLIKGEIIEIQDNKGTVCQTFDLRSCLSSRLAKHYD
jgi:hypothetical protein